MKATGESDSYSAMRPWPWFALAALVYVPVAFFGCSQLVQQIATEEYLTLPLRRAILLAHLPGSLVAAELCILSILRDERHAWLSWLLFVLACSWIGLALGLGSL
jgi:hypothetical protein